MPKFENLRNYLQTNCFLFSKYLHFKFLDFSRWQFYTKLVVAVIPALILGYLLSDKIDKLLESTSTVIITMLLGGVILLMIDNYFKNPTVKTEEKISFQKAFLIGVWQVIAMVPG